MTSRLKRTLLAAPICALMTMGATGPQDPLVGAWVLDSFTDTVEGQPPIEAFGTQPIGLMLFTADGHVSISLMRNPPVAEKEHDSAPASCVSSGFCSYFGTYSHDASQSTWTTHVTGGNVPSYNGTDQTRSFKIEGNILIISEDRTINGTLVQGERIFHRAAR